MIHPTGLPMTVAGAVLGSAVLHATWNALAKAIENRLLASALMGATFLVAGGVWCVFAPVPATASWPFLGASVALQTGYLLLLTAAYARGEFGRVYPVARGTAPVLVTVFSLLALGERLRPGELAGIALVVGALGLLVTVRGRGRAGVAPRSPLAVPGLRGRFGLHRTPPGLGLAAATGLLVAAYTVVDGLGVRQSGSAAGYAAWLMFLQGPLLVATCLVLAGPRDLVGHLRGAAPATPISRASAGASGTTAPGTTAPGTTAPGATASGTTGSGTTASGTGDGTTGERRLVDTPGTGTPSGTPASGTTARTRAGTTASGTPAGRPRTLPRHRRGFVLLAGLGGGLLSLAAYAIVLWAQDRASLSLVSALRETSVLFAGVIGAAFFAEGFSAKQSIAAIGVVAGIALIQLT